MKSLSLPGGGVSGLLIMAGHPAWGAIVATLSIAMPFVADIIRASKGR
ncbi:hypothetical protein HL653_23925 (plasmid) [Sphingomonas sp. AP4-R1]|nr:hypothetical protein [Sphingomonas sp. AP4-R1]QJU60962.1 hypothetical protein HL653_23925 [Sphingomonas sp. AP4-R1]